MADNSIAGKIPIDLVSLIDTLDTTSKLCKTIKLKLLCTWKHLSEKFQTTTDSTSVREFIHILGAAHKDLWSVDNTLSDWYQNKLMNQATDKQLQTALKAYTSDSEFKSIKNSIWGSRVITDIRIPKSEKKAAIKETVTSELTPLVSYNTQDVPFDEVTGDVNKPISPFKQAKLNDNNTITVYRIFQSTTKDKPIPIVDGATEPKQLNEADIGVDIQKKKVCYLKKKGIDWVLYYVPPAEFDKDSPKTAEYKIEKDKKVVKGFARIGDHGPVVVVQIESSEKSYEVRILRSSLVESSSFSLTNEWGEKLNKNPKLELVAFEYRRQHGVILLKEDNKYCAIFFNDKNGPTLNSSALGYFDYDLFEQPCTEAHLNTHIYFKSNGLPFPYFVHVFQSFVLINYYSNNRGAAYVSIRSQRLKIDPTPVNATAIKVGWVWTKSDRYEAEERLMLILEGTTEKKLVKF